VTVSEIAEAAGVSITTVSHALNGKGRLPQHTRERIRRVADAFGYTANPHARGLKLGRPAALAIGVAGFGTQVLVPNITFYVHLTNAASTAALQRGFGLLLAPSTEVDLLSQLSVAGALLVDPVGNEPLIEIARERELPLVTVGRLPGSSPAAAWVDNDNRTTTTELLDHLASRGSRRPALLTTTGHQSYVHDIVQTYRAWCAARGAPSLIHRVRGYPSLAGAATAAGRLLDRDPKPDAIVATLDRLALGVIPAARERRLSIPGDLLLSAFMDSEALAHGDPPTTAVDLDTGRIGAAAANMLIDLVEGEDSERTLLVPGKIITRESTGGLAAAG
jgi:DNA-binding LacI/PurR family transcriptional regulator